MGPLKIGRYESSKDAVFMVSQELIIRSLNMSAQHMFGYFSKEVVGTNISALLSKHYRKVFKSRVDETIQTSRPGDLEEIREAYCERKTGDQFFATIRIVNNLASTTMEPGLIVSVHDENEFTNLQSRSQRRLKELTQQVEAKEAMLLKAQTLEEREFLATQRLKEEQMQEKKRKKAEFYKELKKMHGIPGFS